MKVKVLWVAVAAGLVMAGACSNGDDESPDADAPAGPQVSEVVEVATAAHTPYNLSVAARGDLVAVAWNDFDEEAATESPTVAVSTDGGSSFGAPVAVDADDPYVAYPQVAVDDDGTIYVGVTLYEQDEADGRPGLYRSDDDGASFALVADLADAPRVAFTAVGTSVAVSPDGDTVLMAWSAPGDETTPGPLVAVASDDGGETFGDAAELAGEAGAGRARAYADDAGAGVAGVARIPLEDAPAPTPANPNPVTSTTQATVWPYADGAFGPGDAVGGEGAEVLDEGPGATGTTVAWWEASEEEAALRAAPTTGGDASTVGAIADPLRVPSPVEVASDEGGSWFLTLDVPDPEGVEPAPLVLAHATGGDEGEILSVFDATATRSGEEYDLASLGDDEVVVAWFDDGAVLTQRVTA